MNYGKFNVQVIAYCILFFLIVGIFNALVDPYLIFRSPLVEGFNFQKPEIDSHTRMTKTFHLKWMNPELLVIGDSSVAYGINPGQGLLGGFRVYNLGLPGANIYELYKYVKYAVNACDTRHVVVFVSLKNFLKNQNNKTDFNDLRLTPFRAKAFMDYYKSLFTLNALSSSFVTITSQDEDYESSRNGFLVYRNNKKFQRTQNRFLVNEAGILVAYLRLQNVIKDNNEKLDYSSFVKLLNISLNNQVKIDIVITPLHAREMLLVKELGLRAQYDIWKHKVLEIVTKRGRGEKNINVYDYANYNECMTEKLPASYDSTKPLNWYWESTHFKPEFGTLIMDEVLGCKKDECYKIGTKLTASNYRVNETNFLLKREMYEKNLVADGNDIKRLIGALKSYLDVSGIKVENAPQDIMHGVLHNAIMHINGDKLVRNGNFNDSRHWYWGTPWTHQRGRAYADGSQKGNAYLSTEVSIIPQNKYLLEFDLSRESGALDVTLGGDTKWGISEGGKVNLSYQVKDSTRTLRFIGNSSFKGSIDNVSLMLSKN